MKLVFTSNGFLALKPLVDLIGVSFKTAVKWYDALDKDEKCLDRVVNHDIEYQSRKLRSVSLSGLYVILGKAKTAEATKLRKEVASNHAFLAESLKRYKENAPHVDEVERLKAQLRQYEEFMTQNNLNYTHLKEITNEQYPFSRRSLPASRDYSEIRQELV